LETKYFSVLEEPAAEQIAALFGVPLGIAPYQFHGRPVYRLSLSFSETGQTMELVLWPELRRVDVRTGVWALVFRAISAIEIYPGVEVLFRRQDPPGHLFVSVNGRVEMAV
jgi:hypothetical protein